MTEKVSVIIPIYNDEKYLRTCLDSVVRQTYSDLEIILVDDGSTDGSAAICKEYQEKDARVRVLREKNSGVGAATNAGLAMATGAYILLVDDDDWLNSHQVEILHNLLKKTSADIAACNYNIYGRDHQVYYWIDPNNPFAKTYSVKEWFQFEDQSDPNRMLIVFTVPWGKLYKRSLFKHIAYPINRPIADDLTTWKIYLLADKISYVNRALYIHRERDLSLSHSTNDADLYPLDAVEARLSLLKILGLDTKNEENVYRQRLAICADAALKKGDYVKYHDAKQKLAIFKKYGKQYFPGFKIEVQR